MALRSLQWVFGFIVVLVLLIAGAQVLSGYDFKSMVNSTVLNTIGFLLGYSFLKPLRSLVFWKVFLYITVITGANWLLFHMWDSEWILLRCGQFIWFSRAVMPFVVSILLNIGFLKYLFRIKTRDAILMGALIGMVHAHSLIVELPIPHFPPTKLTLSI
jgi:hypothetical protein